jgi:hypothetical protein
MQRPVVCLLTKQQTTVSPWVFWIIFDDLSHVDHVSHVCRTDQTLRPGHLLHRMGKKQDFSRGCLANVLQNAFVCVHVGQF